MIRLERFLDAVAQGMASSRLLKLNSDKTEVLRNGSRGELNKRNNSFPKTVSDQAELKLVAVHEYLAGATVSPNLLLDKHVTAMASLCSASISCGGCVQYAFRWMKTPPLHQNELLLLPAELILLQLFAGRIGRTVDRHVRFSVC